MLFLTHCPPINLLIHFSPSLPFTIFSIPLLRPAFSSHTFLYPLSFLPFCPVLINLPILYLLPYSSYYAYFPSLIIPSPFSCFYRLLSPSSSFISSLLHFFLGLLPLSPSIPFPIPFIPIPSPCRHCILSVTHHLLLILTLPHLLIVTLSILYFLISLLPSFLPYYTSFHTLYVI